jgi:hypothetical protein
MGDVIYIHMHVCMYTPYVCKYVGSIVTGNRVFVRFHFLVLYQFHFFLHCCQATGKRVGDQNIFV